LYFVDIHELVSLLKLTQNYTSNSLLSIIHNIL